MGFLLFSLPFCWDYLLVYALILGGYFFVGNFGKGMGRGMGGAIVFWDKILCAGGVPWPQSQH
ncbi:MAG: hypothetical protein D3922_13025 [Candidatus Electrothrix sp. AR1]|nr:hypothetical protein [Candidatus Electrothrix sp. AR1]